MLFSNSSINFLSKISYSIKSVIHAVFMSLFGDFMVENIIN